MVLNDNKIFKESFDSISNIVDETICDIDSDGFRINAIDRSHICFVSLDLQKEIFDEFECEVPERICVDTDEFNRVLKRCKKNDTLELSCDDNNLIIVMEGDVTRKFKIKLIDSLYETPVPPKLNPPAVVLLESDMLKDFITDMELFNTNLDFKVDEDFFTVESSSEFGDSKCDFYHGEEINGSYKSSFSIDKLKLIMKASRFSPIVEVGVGNDMPVIINFKLDSEDGSLSFLLAPRLNTDDE